MPTTITCPAGRHVQDVRGSGANERRAMREYGCPDCRREAAEAAENAETDALFDRDPITGAPHEERGIVSDRRSGDVATVRANDRMDDLRGGAPRPGGA